MILQLKQYHRKYIRDYMNIGWGSTSTLLWKALEFNIMFQVFQFDLISLMFYLYICCSLQWTVLHFSPVSYAICFFCVLCRIYLSCVLCCCYTCIFLLCTMPYFSPDAAVTRTPRGTRHCTTPSARSGTTWLLCCWSSTPTWPSQTTTASTPCTTLHSVATPGRWRPLAFIPPPLSDINR